MMIGLLKWIDINMEKLLIDNLMTEDFELSKRGIEIIIPGKIRNFPISSKEQNDQTSVDQDVKAKEKEKDQEHEEIKKLNDTQYPSITSHQGTQIMAEGLTLTGIGILECIILRLVLLCQRCKVQIPVELVAGNTFSSECFKCHTSHIISYRKDQMHELSSVLGYLDIQGCNPFDTLSSKFTASCLECSNEVTVNQLPMTGLEYFQNCQKCHKKASLSIKGIKYIKIKDEKVVSNGEIKKKSRKKDPSISGLKVGYPLPNEGTCKHYKKSFKWFRFPCCGRAFPCDICHEENVKGSHEMTRANRILCGMCSRDQPISDKPCVCGFNPFGTRRSHFWEGGTGMRDQNRLCKNDARKYVGLHKTHSQKSQRVGPKK